MSGKAKPGDARALVTDGEASLKGPLPADGTRRMSPRLRAKDSGAVTVHSVSYVIEMCNVSRQGAQIRVRQGLVPFVGQAVVLQFVDGTSVSSRVIWERDTLIGLRFDEPLPDVLDGIYFDDLGSDYFRAVLKLQIMRP